MQGVGNDFVVMDAADVLSDMDWPQWAVRLCERRFSVGADGLLVVSKDAPGASFSMRMFNPDGTEDMCGNGLRCVGLWAHRADWLRGATEFTVATKEGPKRVNLEIVDAEGRTGLLRVDMGRPLFAPAAIPFCAAGLDCVKDYALPVGERTFRITSVNTGSTHTVIFGNAPSEEEFQRFSPLIENHPLFPERTSVLWAAPDGPNRFRVRIWERGAGETMGCGTGACAVGVAARLHGFVTGNTPLDVVSKGGTLTIDWPGDDAPVAMTGPAQFVYEGETAFAAAL